MDEKPRGPLEPLSPGRGAALALAIIALAVIVVSASRPGEWGPAGPPTSAETGAAIIRAAIILFAIGEAVVLGLIVWALWPAGRRHRIRTRRGTLAVAVASFLQSAGALVLFWYYIHYRTTVRGSAGLFPNFGLPRSLAGIPDGRASVGPGQEWVTALIVIAALALGIGFAFRGVRFRRRRSPLAKLAEQLQGAVEEGLEELEAEADPRRAVIAAYARMERALARVGLARARHEAAFEYLDRLLVLLDARGPAASRLTELFQLAKFSDHQIDGEMQREAIRALAELRDDLRARAAESETGPRAVPA